MKILSSLFFTLFLSMISIQDVRAASYEFQGAITAASTGCNICDPVPAGLDTFTIAVGDAFTGTLNWNYDPATAVSPAPGIVEADGWFSSFLDFNGLNFSANQGGYFFLRDGQFYFEDETPDYSLDDGLYMGLPDALRIFFNSSTYVPADGLPTSLDLSAFDSVTVEVSPLLDYSWDIKGTMTSFSVVPLPASVVLLVSGLVGLVGFGMKRSRT
jgi:hypothetical protein